MRQPFSLLRRAIKCRGQFSALAPKHAERPAALRVSYGHDQVSIRPTVATRNAFSRFNGLRNLNSHVGKHSKWPAAKTGGLKYKARGTQYEIRDATVLTQAWLISGYQVG